MPAPVDSAVVTILCRPWGSSAICSDPGNRRRYFVRTSAKMKLSVSPEGKDPARRTRTPSLTKEMGFGDTTRMLSTRDDLVRESRVLSKKDPGR
jgi:hypothetical protein